jgi:hypothetical protein
MGLGNLQNYVGSQPIRIEDGGNFYKLCYNNSGAAFTNGDLVQVSELNVNPGEVADTNTNHPTIITPATTAVTVEIGVVANGILGKATIAAGAWGYVQTEGDALATYGDTIAVDDYLDAQDSAKTAIPDGTSGSTAYTDKTWAVAKQDGTVGQLKKVTIYGRDVAV